MNKSQVVLRKLKTILKKNKLKLRASANNDPHYNFKTIRVPPITVYELMSPRIDPWAVQCEHIAHEIGHYLACPKSDRNKRDFGLYMKSTDEQNQEEFKAQIYERAIMSKFGLKKSKSIKTWQNNIYSRRTLYGGYFSVTKWWKDEGEKSLKEFLNAKP